MPAPFPAAEPSGVADSPPPDLDRRLAAHRRAAALARFLAHLRGPLAVVLLIGGGVTLAARISEADIVPVLWTLGAGTLLACGYAAFRARRDRPARRDAAAAVDGALRSGGLLMTLADLPPEARPREWLARLEPRRDRWRDARPPLPLGPLAKTIAVPAAFLALAWAAPVDGTTGRARHADRTIAGDRLTGELARTLAALAGGAAADPAALARAGEDLRRLRAGIGEGGPTASQLEAADALRDRMLGAVAADGAADGATAGRMADTLAAGADLLAGSGLLESDAVRDAAAAAGVGDPAALGALLAAAGANREALAELAAGLTDEQRAALLDAGARLAAGGDPAEALAALPPAALAELTGASLVGSAAAPAVPAAPSPGGISFKLSVPAGVPAGAAAVGASAARTFLPGLTAAAEAAGGFLSNRVPAARPPVAVRERDPRSLEPRPPPPSRRLAAGRPVPPRLRGVVRRYFSGQTPAPPAAD